MFTRLISWFLLIAIAFYFLIIFIPLEQLLLGRPDPEGAIITGVVHDLPILVFLILTYVFLKLQEYKKAQKNRPSRIG